MIAPRLADAAEDEPAAEERMERMSYDNSPVRTVAVGRSRRLGRTPWPKAGLEPTNSR